MTLTPFPPGVPIGPLVRGIDRFAAILPHGEAAAADDDCIVPAPRLPPSWREVAWVGFADGADRSAPAAAPLPLALPANVPAKVNGTSHHATPTGSDGSGEAAIADLPPETVAAMLGPAGTPAVTQLPRSAWPAAARHGAAVRAWRQASAGFGRALRIAAIAMSMGVIAVFAYQGGEHLAGLASVMTSAAAPGAPAATAPEPGPMRAPADDASAGPSGPAALYLAHAKAGDATAQFNLAALYARGDGVPQDFGSAAAWFAEAAASGNAVAQFDLAVMYERGLGVGQNMTEAILWYRRAAEHDYAPAQYNLALALVEGRGVRPDAIAAAHWYQQAAKQGLVAAMLNLAVIYDYGAEGGRSLSDAYAWYRAAARGGDAAAERRARELFQQFAGAEKGKAVLAAAMVVDMISQPLANPNLQERAIVPETAVASPAAAQAPALPAAAAPKPAEPGGLGTSLKPGGWKKRGGLDAKSGPPRPAG